MNRTDLQRLSSLRRKEAKTLLDCRCYPGAYYLSGYAVECALKSCICKETQKYDFPNKELANKSHIHILEELIKVAGLAKQFKEEKVKNPNFELNWAVVKDWSVKKRYSLSITQSEARDIYSAITARKHGVLAWVRRYW